MVLTTDYADGRGWGRGSKAESRKQVQRNRRSLLTSAFPTGWVAGTGNEEQGTLNWTDQPLIPHFIPHLINMGHVAGEVPIKCRIKCEIKSDGKRCAAQRGDTALNSEVRFGIRVNPCDPWLKQREK